mgnify:CR=1 FL=1|jgi:hypothetical protein
MEEFGDFARAADVSGIKLVRLDAETFKQIQDEIAKEAPKPKDSRQFSLVLRELNDVATLRALSEPFEGSGHFEHL